MVPGEGGVDKRGSSTRDKRGRDLPFRGCGEDIGALLRSTMMVAVIGKEQRRVEDPSWVIRGEGRGGGEADRVAEVGMSGRISSSPVRRAAGVHSEGRCSAQASWLPLAAPS